MVDGEGRSLDTQYYNPGSEIELACVVRNRSLWSTDVLWLKDGQPLDIYNKASISIGSQVDAEHVISRLWIAGASNQDSGNYSCHLPGHMPEEFPRAIVKVLVVDGDFHAAVYGGSTALLNFQNVAILQFNPLLAFIWSHVFQTVTFIKDKR